jgi:plasmid stabilization system protein ParE
VSQSFTFRPRARRDVLEQMLYFEEQVNEETALRYYDAVLTTCQLVAQQPFSGKAFLTTIAALTGLRRLPIGAPFEKYLLFHEPSARGIEVVRVLYGSRDLEPILTAETDDE